MKLLIKIVTTLCVSAVLLYAQKHELTLAVYPNKENKALYQEYKPLIKHLKSELGMEINFTIAKDYNNQIELLTLNKVDLAIMGPYNYIKALNVNPNIKYMVTKQGIIASKVASSYKSVIVTLKSKKIKALKELKNRSFAFTDFNSTSGYLFPTLVLKANKITTKDLSQIYMMKKHTRVMEALSKGSIDAGATSYHNYLKFEKKYGDIFKILYKSEDIPRDAVIASAYMNKKLMKKVEKALLSYTKINKGQKIHAFIKKDESIYDFVKKKAKLSK